MSRKYKFRDNDKLYFVSFAVVYWIDLFIRKQYKDILLDSWNFCMDKKGMELYGWVIMTSHVHMIIGSHKNEMEAIMRDMKKHTSSELRKAINNYYGESRREWMLELMKKAGQENNHTRDFQLWQEDNHPIELSTLKMAHQKLDYIHNNPVEAGIVEKPEDYLYSSARDYYGMKGLIDTILLDPLLM
ncbi:MAG: transposase [Bacteroidetes bacterium]|nr:transposase [Bacteroidota bacterium]